MMRMNKLGRHEGGAAIIEFALAAPVLFTMIFGIAQLGIVMSANAGLQHAVAEGARAAAVYRTAAEGEITAEEIRAVIADARFSLDPNLLPQASVEDGEDAAGRRYFDIELSYQVPLNFVFVSPSVTISESRRVYIQEDDTSGGGGSSSAGSSSTGGEETGSSAGTTTGGDAGTTTGGDAGTSSGTDTSTSTGASTTSSTTTSTSGGNGNGNGNGNGSSGNGNGSSGNGNGNGNGRGN